MIENETRDQFTALLIAKYFGSPRPGRLLKKPLLAQFGVENCSYASPIKMLIYCVQTLLFQ